ncbi:SRPBCC domain-containing protein [Aeromonas rivipollensis]|uniref:SRPBCC domain-containing protein n=1 Tax=Aeromonas rivipollensis TaxID=948519 RepID=UPI0038E23C10
MDDGRAVSVYFDDEQGSTRITAAFDAESEHGAELHRAGWQSILDNFKRYMESAS